MEFKAFISRYLGWCPGVQAVAEKATDRRIAVPAFAAITAVAVWMVVVPAVMPPVRSVSGLDVFVEIGRPSTFVREFQYRGDNIYHSESTGGNVVVRLKVINERPEPVWLEGEIKILEGHNLFETSETDRTYQILTYEPNQYASNPSGTIVITLFNLRSTGNVSLSMPYRVADSNNKTLTSGVKEVVLEITR